MKVRELINELQEWDPDDDIEVWGCTDNDGSGTISSSESGDHVLITV